MKLKSFFVVLLLCNCFTLFADNKSVEMSGNGNIEIPHFDVPSSFTVEAWIKTAQTGTGTIVSWKGMTGDGAASLFRVFEGSLQFGEWFPPSWMAIQTTTKVNAGTWTHVAAVRYEDKVIFYINGEKDSEGTLHDTPTCITTHLEIGAVGTLANERFSGMLDEVRIWNTVRTAEQIKANYNKELVGDEKGLEGYWNFNDDFLDHSSSDRNGTATNAEIVYSDLFNVSNPEITAISFTENDTIKSFLSVSAKAVGTIYWGVVKADETSIITKDILMQGDAILLNSGHEVYNKLGQSQKFPCSFSLTVGDVYKFYAVLKTNDGSCSEVFVSDKIIYQGLKVLPERWDCTDIGFVGLEGNSYYKDDCFHVSGSGSDIWSSIDNFHYAYKKVHGNKVMIAHLKSFTNTNEWNKVGVMLRQSLASNAVNILCAATSSNGVGGFSRSATNASTSYNGEVDSKDRWFKVVYLDGQMAGFSSADGAIWTKQGQTVSCDSIGDYYIGFAVCAHDDNKCCEALFDSLSFSMPSSDIDLRDKPIDAANLDWQSEIPQIIYSNEDLVNLYNTTWSIAADRVRIGPKGLPSSPYLDENCYEDQIWIWDSCFMVLFSKYAPKAYPGKETLNNFYKPMYDGVSTPLRIHLRDNPPLFAWAEYDNYQFSGDSARLDTILINKKYLQQHFNYFNTVVKGSRVDYSPNAIRRGVVKDGDKVAGYTWDGGASGMDNTPRGRDQGGQNNILWIDAISQQALSALYISRLCREENCMDEADKWKVIYDSIKKNINENYWNPDLGFYCDINKDNGQFSTIKTPASFWPLMAEVASKEQASEMVKYLRDSTYLGGKYPWPSLARDDVDYDNATGNYWKGGVWLPLAYMGTKALEKYGYYSLADSLAQKVVMQQLRTYQNVVPHTIWECYSPSCDEPSIEYTQRVRPDFCGWSALGPISLTIENVLGFRYVSAKNKEVDWWLKKSVGRYGIKRLSFGNIKTDLIYNPDTNEIEAITNEEFKLYIHLEGEVYTFNLKKGTQIISLDDLTLVGSVKVNECLNNSFIYDLNGCRCSKVQKGIYIVKGKKVFLND